MVSVINCNFAFLYSFFFLFNIMIFYACVYNVNSVGKYVCELGFFCFLCQLAN
jgi:hypothetical protein